MAKISAAAKQKLQDPRSLLLLCLLGILLTYALATRAIDTGSLGQYSLTFLFLILSINTFVKAMRSIRNGSKR